MCLKAIFRGINDNMDNIRAAKKVRDKNVVCIENANLFFTALLAMFGLAHLIVGI